jgi:hypothetical protein
MSVVNNSHMQQHVTILGWLYVVGHGLFLAIGAFVFLLLTGVGLAVDDPEARSVLLVVGPAIGLLLAVLALPGLAAGFGLLTHKPWARTLAIVIGILSLLNVPIGTAIGIYALWVLVPRHARTYFAEPVA